MSDSVVPIADTVDPEVLLSVLAQVKAGDFTARMPLEWTGVAGKVADGVNDVIIANQALEAELARVSQVVGEQGKLSQRAVLGGWTQSWSGSIESVNSLIEALVRPTSEMQRVIGAVAGGDLSKRVSADVKGEFLGLKNTINAMVDQLNSFASEVTRGAREVGVEDKLGGQAQSKEVGGVRKDLTDNVDQLATNVETRAGVAGLKDTLNEMIRNLLETTRQNVEQDWLKTNRELRASNEALQRQASLLAERNREAADGNRVIERSRRLFEEKAAQLAISSKYKSEFIANMSHELRTPLNSLLILAQQLEDNPDHNMTDTQVQYASVISTSGKELMGLLNSILDLAKVESGTAVVDLTEFPLAELRRSLFREFELVARGKGLAYSIDLAPDSPEDIVTDPQCLRQILKNLLANAFKFTEHGAVHMQIGLADNGWSGETDSLVAASSVLAISVSDTGIGIDDEQQQRIFEAFAQGDGTTARLYGGTGLGLSISRELAGLLGGEITVASEPGRGSTFTVYLPSSLPIQVAPASAARVVPAAGLFGGSAINGMKILLVDDDFRDIFALSALLERGHAEVIVAESGSQALAALETTPDLDVLLMDILMPVMDGYETMRAIRAVDRFKNLPIIAVTGKLTVGERRHCIEAGANDYVPKPVDTAELLAALRPWIASAAQRNALAALAAVPSVTPAAGRRGPVVSLHEWAAGRIGPQIDCHRSNGQGDGPIGGKKILLVDDDFRNIFALTAFLERGRADVIVAESGSEALAALETTPDVDVLLMDILMPLMDGYETMRAIRAFDQFKKLPIIAVTGKVMAGERRRCIEAGANDYIAKPVDTAQLLASLRLWLAHRARSAMA